MELIEKYLPFFQKAYKAINIPYDSDRACVIVEPRKHKYLELVIKNVLYFAPGWSLYIFHSNENEEYVKTIIGSEKINSVHMIPFCKSNITFKDYNILLCTSYFWEWIDSENILIFQTDSYLRKHGIDEFVAENYSYIGAPWRHDNSECHAGNGGISLRKKSKMLEVIKLDYHTYVSHEDGFFNEKLKKLNCKLPTKYKASQFSVETIYYHDPLGVHKYWDYLKDQNNNLCRLEIENDFKLNEIKQQSLLNKFHVVTITSEYNNKLFTSCSVNNIHLTVLELHGSKYLLSMKKYLESMPKNDIVMYLNSTESLVLCDKHVILEKFLEMKTPFIMATERNCHPFGKTVEWKYPKCNTSFKYINVGCYIGYVESILQWINQLDINSHKDEQGIATLSFLEKKNLQLDYNCDLFLSLFSVDENEVEIFNEKVFLKETKSFPCVLNANRSSVNILEKVYKNNIHPEK